MLSDFVDRLETIWTPSDSTETTELTSEVPLHGKYKTLKSSSWTNVSLPLETIFALSYLGT